VALNINNWKKAPPSDLQSTKLRQNGNKESLRNIRQATTTQVKQRVKAQQTKMKLKLKLSQTARQKVSIKTDQQTGLSTRRAQNVGLRQGATQLASKQKSQSQFLKTRDASRSLQKLGQKTASGRPAATKGAVVAKQQAPEVQTHRQPQQGTQVPLAAARPQAKTPARTKTTGRTVKPKGKDAGNKAAIDPKIAKQLKAAKQGVTPRGGDSAARASHAGTAAAKAQPGVKDGALKSKRKDSEKKERTTSLTQNKGKANSKSLGKLLEGGGFDTNVDVTAQETDWQPGASEAVGKDGGVTRSLMDDNPEAMTFTAAAQHEKNEHALWNRNQTFANKVIKPRLEQIADLNEKLGERLAEVALSEKVNGDPELKELFMSNKRSQTNPYGGMSA